MGGLLAVSLFTAEETEQFPPSFSCQQPTVPAANAFQLNLILNHADVHCIAHVHCAQLHIQPTVLAVPASAHSGQLDQLNCVDVRCIAYICAHVAQSYAYLAHAKA